MLGLWLLLSALICIVPDAVHGGVMQSSDTTQHVLETIAKLEHGAGITGQVVLDHEAPPSADDATFLVPATFADEAGIPHLLTRLLLKHGVRKGRELRLVPGQRNAAAALAHGGSLDATSCTEWDPHSTFTLALASGSPERWQLGVNHHWFLGVDDPAAAYVHDACGLAGDDPAPVVASLRSGQIFPGLRASPAAAALHLTHPAQARALVAAVARAHGVAVQFDAPADALPDPWRSAAASWGAGGVSMVVGGVGERLVVDAERVDAERLSLLSQLAWLGKGAVSGWTLWDVAVTEEEIRHALRRPAGGAEARSGPLRGACATAVAAAVPGWREAAAAIHPLDTILHVGLAEVQVERILRQPPHAMTAALESLAAFNAVLARTCHDPISGVCARMCDWHSGWSARDLACRGSAPQEALMGAMRLSLSFSQAILGGVVPGMEARPDVNNFCVFADPIGADSDERAAHAARRRAKDEAALFDPPQRACCCPGVAALGIIGIPPLVDVDGCDVAATRFPRAFPGAPPTWTPDVYERCRACARGRLLTMWEVTQRNTSAESDLGRARGGRGCAGLDELPRGVRLSLESYMKHHPGDDVFLFSRTLCEDSLGAYEFAGYRARVVPYEVEEYAGGHIAGSAAEIRHVAWSLRLKKYGVRWVSDVLAMLLLHHYGGTYADLDVVFLRPVDLPSAAILPIGARGTGGCTGTGRLTSAARAAAALGPDRAREVARSFVHVELADNSACGEAAHGLSLPRDGDDTERLLTTAFLKTDESFSPLFAECFRLLPRRIASGYIALMQMLAEAYANVQGAPGVPDLVPYSSVLGWNDQRREVALLTSAEFARELPAFREAYRGLGTYAQHWCLSFAGTIEPGSIVDSLLGEHCLLC
ncbi:unnamed protein product [Pedinophyceae sp. YPF-701]|nr:unnamed protein product [Pedinophyceae sp. YPF-701]